MNLNSIRHWLCGRWCERKIVEEAGKAWRTGYYIGYSDGKAGREPAPPPPIGKIAKEENK